VHSSCALRDRRGVYRKYVRPIVTLVKPTVALLRAHRAAQPVATEEEVPELGLLTLLRGCQPLCLLATAAKHGLI